MIHRSLLFWLLSFLPLGHDRMGRQPEQLTLIVGHQKQQQQRAIFALILGELLRLNCARSYRPTLYGKIIKLLSAACCVSSCTTVENTADHNNKQKGLKVAKHY